MRLAYNQADMAIFWWADGYLDFNGAQSPRVREAIAGWMQWQRREQLPVLARHLQDLQRQVMESTDAAAICRWQGLGQRAMTDALEVALPALADVARTLTPEQLQHLERRYAKGDEEFRARFTKGDVSERRARSFKTTVERAEMIYGRLNDAQRQQLRQAMSASPFDAELWFTERVARHRNLMLALQGSVAVPQPAGDRARVVELLRGVAEQVERSPRPAYRAYRERLAEYSCSLYAKLHNATTPAQREHARARFKGWEEDLRVLAGDAADASNQGSGTRNRRGSGAALTL